MENLLSWEPPPSLGAAPVPGAGKVIKMASLYLLIALPRAEMRVNKASGGVDGDTGIIELLKQFNLLKE